MDEANERTYVVMADRTLTDGEVYRAIRLEVLRRKSPIARGERVVISTSKRGNPEASAKPADEPPLG